MDAIIQYSLTLPPMVTLMIFFMVWATIAATFMTLAITPLFLHEDVYPSYSQKLAYQPSINDAYLWLQVDEPIQTVRKEFTESLVDGRLTVRRADHIIKRYATQVNPKCIDHGKFLRACWAIYGTGRTEPDPVS